MSIEERVDEALRERPASGGRLIERFQASGAPELRGRAGLVYAALARLRAEGRAAILVKAPGEAVWGPPGVEPPPPRAPGHPPSFSLGAKELDLAERALRRITRGLEPHWFQELRRAVVADADRRVFHGARLPGAVLAAVRDLGPPRALRRMLRAVERGRAPPLRLRELSRRVLLIPLAAILLLAALRLFVVGVYRVPTASMAPVLLPAGEGGDARVLANLTAYLLGPPRRGDIVVFRRGDRLYVKRIMGLPGEAIRIAGGDVLVDGKPLVKERPLLDRVKVPLYRLADLRRDDAARTFETPGPLRIQHRNAKGELEPATGEGGGRPRTTPEAVLRLEIRAGEEPASVTVAIGDGPGRLVVVLATDREGGVAIGGLEAARRGDLRLGPGSHEVWITNADRVLRVEVDGREEARAAIPSHGGAARVSIALGGEGISLLRAEVARDAHWRQLRGVPNRWTLDRAQVFVLGDNSRRSRDSRYFGGVPVSSLLGRVYAVVWPLSRARVVR